MDSTDVEALRQRCVTLEEALKQVTAERDAALQKLQALGVGAGDQTATPATGPAASAAEPSAGLKAPGAILAEPGECSFLAPRGRFRVRLAENATTLIGKSFEVVVPHSSVERIWSLPEATGQGTLLVLGLNPPAINGKTSLSFVLLHSKPADADQAFELHGKPVRAKPSAALCEALETLTPDSTRVSAISGFFKPMRGHGALACHHKATEAAAYLLDTELLVKEGGKITVMPYARLRAEVHPPSGLRTFDLQLECAPSAAELARAAAAGAGAPPAKPTKMELSMISADEYAGVAEALKKKKVNVNGNRDGLEAKQEAVGSAAAKSAAAEVAPSSDEEDDDSDDDEDDDFAPSDGSDPEEEYDSEDGVEIPGVDPEGPKDDDDDDDDDDDEEEEEEEEEGAVAEGEPPAKRSKTDVENDIPRAVA